jgi:hypothetical protein
MMGQGSKPYQTDTPTENTTGGKGMQDMDSALEPFGHFSIIISKLKEILCLLVENCDDGVSRVASSELDSEVMFDKV